MKTILFCLLLTGLMITGRSQDSSFYFRAYDGVDLYVHIARCWS